jgi:uncharacterized delta-60 repeat protein
MKIPGLIHPRATFAWVALIAMLGLAACGDDGTAVGDRLDTTLGTNGKVTTAIGGQDFATAVAIQSDGKIVVAGYSLNGANDDFALARYNTDGSLDTTFDTDGKVTTAIGASVDRASAVAIQSDGKILVAGFSSDGFSTDFALARYNADGSLDTTFSSDGKVTTAIGASYDYASAMAIQSNGKIVVAGSALINYTDDFALARYNADGSLDTTFQIAGKATTAIRSDDSAHAVAIQSDGKIVVVGETWGGSPSNSDFALVRYLP